MLEFDNYFSVLKIFSQLLYEYLFRVSQDF